MKRLIFKISFFIKFIVKLYTGYYLFMGIYLLLKKIISNKKSRSFPIMYVKEFPFHLNRRTIHSVRLASQFIFTCLTTMLIAFIFLDNIAPFGITVHYSSDQKTLNISQLGPNNRIQKKYIAKTEVTAQKDDLIYFTTEMPFIFNTAKVRITFQNTSSEQMLFLGYKDKEEYHYDTKLIHAPILDSLSWQKTGISPTLYQKNPVYKSVNDFLQSPPKDALIGTYAYDIDLGENSNIKLPNYSPSSTDTIINTPIRGKVVMYAYLDHEPFNMVIQKQDLNRYEDPDTLTVNIFKDKDLVYQVIADDDGITDASQKILSPQEINIKNPSTRFPESGVYKIIIDANADTIIKSIKTNLHKIVFQGSLFLAGNKDAYPTIVSNTIPTELFTNALMFSASTVHNHGFQNIQVGDKILKVDSLNLDNTIIPKDPLAHIFIPKNDVIIRGFQGFFSFTKDQFFLPNQYHIIPVSQKEDLDLVDYVVTDYTSPQKNDDWQVAERTFNIDKAVIKDGKLSWTIQAPQLKKNNREILIKSIDILFKKKAWLLR